MIDFLESSYNINTTLKNCTTITTLQYNSIAEKNSAKLGRKEKALPPLEIDLVDFYLVNKLKQALQSSCDMHPCTY